MKFLSNIFVIFSLFFGAGNVVFPILLGLKEKNYFLSAFLGLLVSAIILPCLGLVSVILYKGSLNKFFEPWRGWLRQVIIALMASLLGPLAVMPRCIIVAHASIEGLGTTLSLPFFSFIFCLFSFACLWSKTRVFDLLGKFLSPILVLSLLAIIITAKHDLSAAWSVSSFSNGFLVGYNTLDLVAALFFAPSIYICMKESSSKRSIIWGAILAFLMLALVYLGLASAASNLSITNIKPEALLRELSKYHLGRGGAYLSCISVARVLTGALRRFLISKYAKIPLSKLMEVLKWKLTINYLLSKKTFRFGVLKEKEEHLFLES